LNPVPPHWRAAALEPPRAFAPPPLAGTLRTLPEDFEVEEELGFAPDGAGQHVLLKVRKRSANTEWVARALASHARARPSEVGFAGLKDRHAVAVQWFTVPGGVAPVESWLELKNSEFAVLEAHPHGRKLRRGALAGNRFRIRVRALRGKHDELEDRLALIRARGVPNYFGPQRFGREGANLQSLARWALEGREPRTRSDRSFTLSAARSVVFNAVLAERVRSGSWDRLLEGEIVNLEGSGSVFRLDAADDPEVLRRCVDLDLHPTGPLWGRGDLRPRLDVAALEERVGGAFGPVMAVLEQAGLQHERRALRLRVEALEARLHDDLELTFRLGAGAFATAVLRELVDADVAGVTT
jgi:tRNA pseudouridine13 synthase